MHFATTPSPGWLILTNTLTMPRLLNRGRPSAVDSPSRAGTSTSLPPYQPPSCGLNDSARRALGELSNNRGTSSYETQLKDSIRQLGLSVGDLHERLRAQQERLQWLQERRQEKGTSKTPEEERLEAHIADFETEVDELTQESEQSIRDVIDHRAEIEDQATLLRDLYTKAEAAASTSTSANAAGTRTRTGQQQEAAAQDGEPNPEQVEDQKEEAVASTLDAFRDGRAEKKAEYEQLTPHQRYGVNNDYAGFKKLWHDAAAGEGGPPLPDASRWFRSDGRPVMTRPGANTRRSTMGAVDDDDDIAIAREVLSLNCPLTLVLMEEPYSNVKCKHTFEKEALLAYLPVRGEAQCPQTGCSQVS